MGSSRRRSRPAAAPPRTTAAARPQTPLRASAPTRPQFHSPTGVTHCADAFFTRAPPPGGAGSDATAPAHAPPAADTAGAEAAAPNLIVARATRLEVYSPRFGSSAASGSTDAAPQSPYESCGLQLLGSFPLHGVVEDMAVLRGRAGAGQRDAVMLAFRCAGRSRGHAPYPLRV
jgi:hypothetical protein